jgi:uncharacterized membrane protein
VIWGVVVALAAINAAFKAIGPALLGGRRLPPRAAAVFALLAPALLTALVITQLANGPIERVAGVAVAGVAALARVPLILALVLGALTAALLRA